ncbi:MAG: hypothetical protein AAF752_16815 [Bacteroidota bacterium]
MTSCSAQDPAENTAPVQDPFELRGTYAWTFDIPNYGTQVSKNVFGAELVEYSMDGPAYTTRYDIHLESFDAAEGRWVGHTGNGVYYVMFFKDVTDESVTIYKHKCVDQDEAYAFAFPGPDATADHGWNVYVRQEPF